MNKEVDKQLYAWLLTHMKLGEYGDTPSSQRGIGSEPDDVVVYQSGDDARFINWKLTSKIGTPVRNRYNTNNHVDYCILHDISPNWRWCWDQVQYVYNTCAYIVSSNAGMIKTLRPCAQGVGDATYQITYQQRPMYSSAMAHTMYTSLRQQTQELYSHIGTYIYMLDDMCPYIKQQTNIIVISDGVADEKKYAHLCYHLRAQGSRILPIIRIQLRLPHVTWSYVSPTMHVPIDAIHTGESVLYSMAG